MKFVIVSPRQSCGGPIVLHKLCQLLYQNGYDAKVFYIGNGMEKKQSQFMLLLHSMEFLFKDVIKQLISKVPINNKKIDKYCKGYRYVPVRGVKRKYVPFVDNDTIVVYPEMCYGNILHAKKVVRWLLFFNQFNNDNSAFGSNDLIIAYRSVFNDITINPENKIVTLTNFDFELYKNIGAKERKGKAFIIRKGINRTDIPTRLDGVVIDNLPEKKIVDIFNNVLYCYSYDTQTFYSKIAAACGCISVVVLEPGKTIQDYLNNDDVNYGVAYGDSEEELLRAKNTVPDLIIDLKKIEINNLKNLDKFIFFCQEHFY